MSSSRLLSQFRISAAMQPYVLRVRLRGTDFNFGSEPEQAVAYTKCIRKMRRILVEKRRIPAIAADRAILKSLEAAFDFQSADLRYRFLETMEAQSHTTLDHLIRGLRQLSNAIAQLPPNSKGELNKRVVGIIGQARFNSEMFIEIVDTITAALPEIRPRRLAENILSLIHPEPGGARRAPIIDQWEAMPATTRVKVEGMVPANPSRSLVRWLDQVADLLEGEQPALSRIPGAERHTAPWASNQGRPMCAMAIYEAVRNRTRRAFGFAVNLHRFRHAAASFWSIRDPANVRGAKDLLGHYSLGTMDKHYIIAQSRVAGRVLARAVDAARKLTPAYMID